jgi:hypothetical protein
MSVNLRLGSKGIAVGELQANLKAMGIPVSTDRYFGPKTDAAVRQFQKARRLPVDGVAGPAFWRAMHGAAPRTGGGSDHHDPFSLDRWLKSLARPNAIFGATMSQAPAPVSPFAPQPPKAAPAAAAPTGVPSFVTGTENTKHKRVTFEGYEGRGYVIHQDFKKFEGCQVQLCGEKVIRYHEDTPLKNECAQWVQLWGVPRTTYWRRGPQVCHMKPGELAPGTVIATLRDDKYYSDYSGRSHVGIYLGHDPLDTSANSQAGVTIFDQYNGAKITTRKKLYRVDANAQGGAAKKVWTDSAGVEQTKRVNWTKDGEEYFVLLTAI